MSNVLGPDCALNIHQNPGLGTLQLDHHNWLEVASLVPVGVEIAREASEWCVGHLQIQRIVGLVNKIQQ